MPTIHYARTRLRVARHHLCALDRFLSQRATWTIYGRRSPSGRCGTAR
jgi:hypothetical protein